MRFEQKTNDRPRRANRLLIGTSLIALAVAGGSGWLLTRSAGRRAPEMSGRTPATAPASDHTPAREMRRQLPPRLVREQEGTLPHSDPSEDQTHAAELSARPDPGVPVGTAWAQPSVETQALIEEQTNSAVLIPDPEPAPGTPEPDDQLPTKS